MFRRFERFVDPFVSYDTAATPPAGLWRFIASYMRPFRTVIVLSLTLSLISASLEIWLIGYAGTLVDRLAATPASGLWPTLGLELGLVAAIVLIIRPLAKFLREGFNDVALMPNGKTLVAWRGYRHMLRQSVGWFQNNLSGRLGNNVDQAGAAATGVVYTILNTLAYVGVYVVGALVLMATIDPRLILPIGLWLGLYLLFMTFIVPRYRNASGAYQEAQSNLMGLVIDTFANIDTIKVFGDTAEEDREAHDRFAEMRRRFVRERRLELATNATMTLLGSVLMVSLIGLAILLWQSGEAPLGLVAVAVALSIQITGMGEWLLDGVANLFGHLGVLREAMKTVAQPIDIPDVAQATPLRISGGAIDFAHVTHRYGRDVGGLDDISLVVDPGEKIGLVGRSGAGKSTLVNLLLRFHALESGTIAIDGQDIASVTQESLRRGIAMVPQTAALLHRSVRDNIAFGRPDATQAMIESAAAKAHADGFIPGLRDQQGRAGYDAQVGERGVKLSGGQRQRIALARAILKDAPILILDEATSALDSEVEAAIQDTLYGVMEGKTVIAIAHRLSTIAHMDRIVVLDEGRVAEQGTHTALLARDGIYAGLWARQSGGFIGAAE